MVTVDAYTDDFERGTDSFEQYAAVLGSSSDIEVQDGDPISGDFSAEIQNTGGSNVTFISSSGLAPPQYPSRGDAIRIVAERQAGGWRGRQSYGWALDGSNEGYWLEIYRDSTPTTYLRIRKGDPHTGTVIGSIQYSFDVSAAITIDFGQTNNDDIEVLLRSPSSPDDSFLVTDTDYDSGNVGIAGSMQNDTSLWFDSVTYGFENLAVQSVDTHDVTIAWDNLQRPTEYVVLRETQDDSGSYGTQSTVATLSADSGSFTDNLVEPGNTYRYTLEYRNQNGNTMDSDTVEASTPGIPGALSEEAAPGGWRAEIESESGDILEPDIVSDPKWTPRLNDLPRVEIPVPSSDRWSGGSFDRADMKVYKDGRKLPIDELNDVEHRPGETVLEGIGGTELLDRVNVEYDVVASHTAAKNLVQDNTTLATNVDDPVTITLEDETLQQEDDGTDIINRIAFGVATTAPIDSDGSVVKLLPSAYWIEGEDFSLSGSETGESNASAAEAEVVFDDTGFSSTVNINTEYEMPGEDVGVAVRVRNPDDPDSDTNFEGAGFDISVDGELVVDVPNGRSTGYDTYEWIKIESGLVSSINGSTPVEIEAGSLGSGDRSLIDAVVVYDTRFSYNFDNTTDSNDALAGPETYPDQRNLMFEDAIVVYNVSGGELSVNMNDTSGNQQLAMSDDGGQSWVTADNTSSFSTDSFGPSSKLRARVRLSRYGSGGTTSPSEGFKGQSLDSYTLRADLDDTPTLQYQGFDDTLLSVLRSIADQGNFMFEIRQTDESTTTLEWTRYGIRSSDLSPPVEDFSVSRSTESIRNKAVVYGSNRTRYGEPFTSNYGTPVSLDSDSIREGSETVYDGSTYETFEIGSDYEMDYSAGEITVLQSGSMSDNTGYDIDYKFQIIGQHTDPNAPANPRTIVEEFADINTEGLAGRVALILIEDLKDPRWRADVTVTELDPSQSLVSELNIGGVPSDVPLEAREIKNTDFGVAMRLGRSNSIRDSVQDIRERLSSAIRNK